MTRTKKILVAFFIILLTLAQFYIYLKDKEDISFAATQGRHCWASTFAATGSFPANGQNVSEFDTDLTVNLFKTGANSPDLVIQGMLIGGGWTTIGTHAGVTTIMDSIKGPIDLLKVVVSACSGDCTTALVICGRTSS